MRKLLIPLLAILVFASCKKHQPEGEIEVCHKDQKEGISHTIIINANELPAHLAHGDLVGECPVVTTIICDQVWMVKNLDVDHYRNGDPIPQVSDETEWRNLTTGAWCYYNNDPGNGAVYGKLYNWYAVNDPRGLAPEGWHFPSDAEWTTLITCLGGNAVAGGKMKSIGTIEDDTGLWFAPNTDATNNSGFTGLPGGLRGGAGKFFNLGLLGFWWSSTESFTNTALVQDLYYGDATIVKGSADKYYAFSARCVKD